MARITNAHKWYWATRQIRTAKAGETFYYVRPAGDTYGAGDGTTYDDAWAGFDEIDWDVVSGNSLYIAGTHTESLTVGADSVTIRGDYSEDSGIINNTASISDLVTINNKQNIILNSLTVTNATQSNIVITGNSTVTTNDCLLQDSGNQNLQCEGTSVSTHNNIICTGGVDDGVSGHDTAIITLNGSSTNISGNNQGVNVIENCVININCNIGVNTQYDIYGVNNTGSGVVTINMSNVSTAIVFSQTDCLINLTNCQVTTSLTVNGTVPGTASAIATNCIIEEAIFGTYTEGAEFNDCLIKNISGNIGGSITFNDSLILDRLVVYGDVTANRCLFTCDNAGANHVISVDNSGNYESYYSIYKNIPSAKFAILYLAGTTGKADNNTFIGVSKVGRGIYLNVDFTANNNIFTDLDYGLFQAGGTVVSNNSVYYDNTVDIQGTVTNNNQQTGDPLLADVANNDFSPGVGSSAIGNGATLTESTGIDTADWGNGTNEVPTVTTKEQGASWDIGAYIS